MSRSFGRATPWRTAAWLLAATVAALGGASNAMAQSCNITYTWPTWVGGNGFGASIDIRNTGPAINSSWSLVFNFPNGQTLQNGWPVSVTQSGTTVTATSTQAWSNSIPTNGVFNVAFNGLSSGTNNPPTAFTLNGTACSIGNNTNTPPTVQITAPANGASISTGVITFTANASDPGGAVARVEFRLDGNLLASDTTAPYATSFDATPLAAGAHTLQATAVDNGTPALTAVQSITVNKGGNTAPQVTLTAPTPNQNFAANTAIPLAATASDPGGAVVRVDFRLDGSTTVVGSDATSPYNFTVPAGLASGSHTVTATAVDNGTPALSTVTPPVTFTIGTGNTAPQVTLTSPTPAQSFPAGSTIPLAATASDPGGAVVRVDFRLDGSTTVVGSDTTSPYNFTVPAGLAAGNHTVTATAVDNGSPALSTVTPAVTFTVGAASANANFSVNAQGRITKNGTLFPVHCGSWFGLEGRHEPSTDADNPRGAPMEQYVGNTFWANGGAGTTRTIAQTMSEISGMGINVIRLPLVPQTLTGTDPQGVRLQPNGRRIFKNHDSVIQPTSRAYLEQMIRAADAANIEIMLDIHSCSNYVGWRKGRLDARPPWVDRDRDNYDFTREDSSCAASGNPASVTRIQAYDETRWLADLRTLAGLGASLGVDNIIGIDIFNEPHDYTWAEWSRLTGRAYTEIGTVDTNHNLLLFVQGVGTNANGQDGTPDTVVPQAHGSPDTNPNWGENLFSAGASPPAGVPKTKLVWSPHTYGPSVFVQKMFMDPAQTQCAGLEGDAAGNLDCNIVINPTLLRAGWEEHFGYLKQMGYAIVVGEFGGNMDWPRGQASIRDQDRWGHITAPVDQQWQDTFVTWMVEKGIEGCYWSINPESGDTAGWYGHAYDPRSNTSGWGEWRTFDQRKTNLLNRLWGR